ncbi:MAG: tyrosine-type recombinase/integrase, partial [Blastocatellia bacterium]
KRLADVNASDIQRLYGHLADKGYGGRTLELIHVTLTNIFRFAAKWDLIRKNPMLAVDRPRHVKKEMQSLNAEQARALLKAIEGEPHECLLQFLIVTGCRPGEALALKWSDINWQNGAVTIQRNLVRLKGGKWQFDDPKTAKGRRTLPLPPKMIKMLSDHRRRQNEHRLKLGAEWRALDLVFPNDFGKPPGTNFIRDKFQVALRQAELPHFRPYDLRHSAATLLMGEGMSPKIVSERLGHANINITLEVYSHVLPTMQEEASEKLEKLLFG